MNADPLTPENDPKDHFLRCTGVRLAVTSLRALGSATVNSRDGSNLQSFVDSRQPKKHTKTATEMVTVFVWLPLLDSNQRHCG